MKKQYLHPSFLSEKIECQGTLLTLSSDEINYGGTATDGGISSSDIKRREDEDFEDFIEFMMSQENNSQNGLWQNGLW